MRRERRVHCSSLVSRFRVSHLGRDEGETMGSTSPRSIDTNTAANANIGPASGNFFRKGFSGTANAQTVNAIVEATIRHQGQFGNGGNDIFLVRSWPAYISRKTQGVSAT